MPATVSTSDRVPRNLGAAAFAYPWQADRGDGTYQNPVLFADYSDPDVVRVGDDFYLTASSFNCTPGLPILHSRDLVNWSLVNHAVKNLPHPRYEQFQAGCGVWAPSIRFHAGKYWIFFPMPDEGLYVVTADHPAKSWSEPRLLQAGRGLIDPCPLWDEDGRAYLVHAYAGSRAGIKHRLHVRPMAPDGSRLLDDGQVVFHQPEKHPTLEGPKFYKRNGWYYILAPAGGVENGWQLALRSKNIYGPYEDKIILAQGSTAVNGPHQGGLVDTADDGWWFIHFQDAGIYGRITHLQPVRWENDWPVIGLKGEPVLRHAKLHPAPPQKISAPQTDDEFDSSRLGLQWQWQANHRSEWYSLSARPGWLRLYPQTANGALNHQPNLLLQKFPARSFGIETLLDCTSLDVGTEAGLMMVGQSFASLAVQHTAEGNDLILRQDHAAPIVIADIAGQVRLRVRVRESGDCDFSYSISNSFVALPQKFRITKGIWIGAKAGLYAARTSGASTGGQADFDYFRFASGHQAG